MQAAVFLDRDNTIIANDGDLGDPNEVKLIQGAAAAIGSLRGLGYKVIVVSNQGGVARGKYTEADVDAVHERINEVVRTQASGAYIDRFYYCPYHPEGTVEKYCREHPWRKPEPGMLQQAAQDMGIDMEQSWMIGDQHRDIEAGAAVGVRTILLRARSAQAEATAGGVEPHFVAHNLVEAVRIIAQQRKPETMEDIRSDEPGSRQWQAAAAASIRRQRGEMARQGDSGGSSAAKDEDTNADRTPTAPVAKAMPRKPAKPFRPLTLGDAEAEHPTPTPTSPAVKPPKPLEQPARPETEPRSSPPRQAPAEPPEAFPISAATETDASSLQSVQNKLKSDEVSLISEISEQTEPSESPQPRESPESPESPAPPETLKILQALERSETQGQPASAESPMVLARTARAEPDSQSERPASAQKPPQQAQTPPPHADLRAAKPSSEPDTAQPPADRKPRRVPRSEQSHVPMETTLRQILQELRNQRGSSTEFTTVGYIAVVLQLVAGVCLLAALLLGRSDSMVFLQWIGSGILIQLAAIAVLMFDRKP